MERVVGEQPEPLSFAQRRLWFIDQLEPESSVYNLPVVVRLGGELDVDALRAALSEVVRRHHVLRTTFHLVDDQPRQVVSPHVDLDFPVTDLSSEIEREIEARRLADEEARRPFDLSRGPMLRAQLLRLADTDHVLLCTIHHIASDGWSMGLLVKEVAVLYQAFAAGQPSPLPELPVQYVDFASWQRQWLSGEVLEKQLAYWKQELDGAPAMLELPTDRPRPLVRSYRGARYEFKLDDDLSEQLKHLSRKEGATLFMLLLAAFNVLLARYSKQADILIGTPVAGRNRREIEDLIGFFVNTLVMRAKVSEEMTFTDFLRQVREVALAAYAHQDIPFEKLVEELQPERALSHQPLFQIVFTLQNVPRAGVQSSNLKLSTLATENVPAKFDLLLETWDAPDGIRGSWTYSSDLFDAATMIRTQAHFATLLRSIVARPDAPLETLDMLTDGEKKERLLKEQELVQANYQRFRSARPRPIRLEI